MSTVLLAIAQTAMWGWTGASTLVLLGLGLAVCAWWIRVEVRSPAPLVDMTMMRVPGFWTTNLAAFLLGGGLYAWLISSALLGVGIGLAFAALGNLIVQAVPSSQTGVASGMNTVLRTLGGALGGGIAATFVAGDMVGGLPAKAGFTRTFAMAALFLVCCVVAGLLIPAPAAAAISLQPAPSTEAS